MAGLVPATHAGVSLAADSAKPLLAPFAWMDGLIPDQVRDVHDGFGTGVQCALQQSLNQPPSALAAASIAFAFGLAVQ